MVSAERARELLSSHGILRLQTCSEWGGEFALPTHVEEFFREVGPLDITIVSYGNPFFLPRLSSLWDFQAGYRWEDLRGNRVDDWADDWLAIASDGGGVFIVSRVSGRVSYDIHGRGVWQPRQLFPDLTSMAASLGYLGTVAATAGDRFTDEEGLVRPEHRDGAVNGLRALLGSLQQAELVLSELW